ncbi:MAG TPA: enoyl-CoA hydratase/isomerase family protein, partial [Burkholderiaceae bacterium]|nr:enoyl-CoA hydratase/isomerase family protein [Burkholderiaceae bacterium]
NFSAGFDFSDFEQLSNADLLWRFVRVQQLLDQLGHYPGLTIGQAHGRNFGAGCDLLAACAIRQGTADSRYRMPGVLFGLILGTRHLGSLVGTSVARHLQLTAGELSASRALELGFLSHLIDHPTQLDTTLFAGSQGVRPATRQRIVQALAAPTSHEDMGRLVESVMAGDIKTRLRAYLGRS